MATSEKPAAKSTKRPGTQSAGKKILRKLYRLLFKGCHRDVHRALLCGGFLALFVFALVYSQLPPIDTVVDYKPKVPMRVWTADGKLIAEFGEERRDFVTIDEIPDRVSRRLSPPRTTVFTSTAALSPKALYELRWLILPPARKARALPPSRCRWRETSSSRANEATSASFMKSPWPSRSKPIQQG